MPAPGLCRSTRKSPSGCAASTSRCCSSPTNAIMPDLETQVGEFYKLGFGEVLCVSAKQNRGKAELLGRILEQLPPPMRATSRRPPRSAQARHRRQAQHRQEHLHQLPGPGRAHHRQRGRRDDARQRRRRFREGRPGPSSPSTPPGCAIAAASAATSSSTAWRGPNGRFAGPTSCCTFSIRSRTSAWWTSSSPATCLRISSRRSSSSTSGTCLKDQLSTGELRRLSSKDFP